LKVFHIHSAPVRINDGQALLHYVPELGRSPFPKILVTIAIISHSHIL
jgi:hypothetical protein